MSIDQREHFFKSMVVLVIPCGALILSKAAVCIGGLQIDQCESEKLSNTLRAVPPISSN